MNFKVGDTVRIGRYATTGDHHKSGDIGTVVHVDSPDDVYPYAVRVRDREWPYDADELEPVALAPEPSTPTDTFTRDVEKVYEEAKALLLKKHQDYGPKNIANSPGGPLMGLSVRLHDKLARLAHLLESGAEPNNESLRDTATDIQNYGAILTLVIDGSWPKGE